MGSHETERYCHYYNNGKICPFEEIGCKFRHEHSPACTFKKCSNSLCQYRHDTNETFVSEDDTNIEVEETMDKRTYLYTSTPKKGKLKCEECSDESQCTNCFVDEYIKNRHEHHNTNIEKSSTFFGPKTDYSESLIKRT